MIYTEKPVLPREASVSNNIYRARSVPIYSGYAAVRLTHCPYEQKKAGSFLLSRECSIIDVRELDFRVRNGNGYYLSTMATGILLPILLRSFIRKTCKGAQIKL